MGYKCPRTNTPRPFSFDESQSGIEFLFKRCKIRFREQIPLLISC